MLTAQENYVPHGIATLFLIFFRGCEAGCVYESYYTHIKLYLSPYFFNYIFEWGVCVCMYVVSAHTKMRQKNEGFMALSVKLFVTLLHASNSYDKWNENERKAKVCRRKISRITWEWKYWKIQRIVIMAKSIFEWVEHKHMSANAIGRWTNIYGYIFLGSWFLLLTFLVKNLNTNFYFKNFL